MCLIRLRFTRVRYQSTTMPVTKAARQATLFRVNLQEIRLNLTILYLSLLQTSFHRHFMDRGGLPQATSAN